MKTFKYLGMAALSTMLLASCASDEPFGGNAGDGVTITLRLPDALATRASNAFGDGLDAVNLTYAVYNEKDTLVETGTKANFFDGTTLSNTLQLNLLNGETYNIIFWADSFGEAKGSPFTFSTTDKSITVDYTKMAANSEKYDAFYASETVTVSGPISRTIILNRPFAQINFGTNDLDKPAVTKEFGDTWSALQTTFTVSGLSNTLNLATGEVSVNDKFTTDYTAAIGIPTGQPFPSITVNGQTITGIEYLQMDYILAGKNENNIAQLDLEIANSSSKKVFNNISVPNAPYRANYRTNIFGQLLTTTNDFQIVIDPIFGTPDYNPLVWDGKTTEKAPIVDNVMTISTPAQLAGMAKMINDGESLAGVTVELAADIDLGNQLWTPIGQLSTKTQFNGIFDGKNHIIRNLYVNYNTNGNEDCAGFFGKVNGNIKNVTISNFSVTGSHYTGALIGYDTNGVDHIENCHAVNGTVTSIPNEPEGPGAGYDNGDKVGGLIGLIDAPVIKNCSVNDVTVTGFRQIGGLIGYSYRNINNCQVSNTTVVRSNKNAYDKTPRAIGKIIADGGGQAIDCTATNVTLIQDGDLVSTPEEFVAALASAKDYVSGIVLNADLDLTGVTVTPVNRIYGLVIDGNGHKISNMNLKGTANNFGLVNTAICCIAKDITFENCTVDGKVNYAGVLFGTTYGTTTIQNVTFNGCTIKAGKKLGMAVGYAAENPVNLTNVKVNNCTIVSTATKAGDEAGQVGAMMGYLNDTATFTNCSVSGCSITVNYTNEDWQSYASGKFLGVYGNREGNAVAINFNNCSVSSTTLTAPGNTTYQNYLNNVGDRLWGSVRDTTGPGKIYVNGQLQNF